MSASWRITGAVLLAGCGGSNAGQSDPQTCAPVAVEADSSVQATHLGGDFTLRLVATSGAKRGATAEGKLQLMPHDSAYRRMDLPDGSGSTTYTLPMYGTAEVDFAAVGAVVPGDVGSSDPASPGVLVIESPGKAMLRLGSEANRRGVLRFDGGYTALQVQQATDKGFAGTWRSGVGTEQSGGHFCANRTT